VGRGALAGARWLWAVLLLVLGVGFFVERLVGELQALRQQLDALTEQLADAEATRQAERLESRARAKEASRRQVAD
jgi:uncharacterized membrane protein